MSFMLQNTKINIDAMNQHEEQLTELQSQMQKETAKILFREIVKSLKNNIDNETQITDNYEDIINTLETLETTFAGDGNQTTFHIDITDDLKYYINKDNSYYDTIMNKIQDDSITENLNAMKTNITSKKLKKSKKLKNLERKVKKDKEKKQKYDEQQLKASQSKKTNIMGNIMGKTKNVFGDAKNKVKTIGEKAKKKAENIKKGKKGKTEEEKEKTQEEKEEEAKDLELYDGYLKQIQKLPHNSLEYIDMQTKITDIIDKYPQNKNIKCRLGLHITRPTKEDKNYNAFNKEYQSKQDGLYIINENEFETRMDNNKCFIEDIIDKENIKPISDEEVQAELKKIQEEVDNETIEKHKKMLEKLNKINKNDQYNYKKYENQRNKIKKFENEKLKKIPGETPHDKLRNTVKKITEQRKRQWPVTPSSTPTVTSVTPPGTPPSTPSSSPASEKKNMNTDDENQEECLTGCNELLKEEVDVESADDDETGDAAEKVADDDVDGSSDDAATPTEGPAYEVIQGEGVIIYDKNGNVLGVTTDAKTTKREVILSTGTKIKGKVKKFDEGWKIANDNNENVIQISQVGGGRKENLKSAFEKNFKTYAEKIVEHNVKIINDKIQKMRKNLEGIEGINKSENMTTERKMIHGFRKETHLQTQREKENKRQKVYKEYNKRRDDINKILKKYNKDSKENEFKDIYYNKKIKLLKTSKTLSQLEEKFNTMEKEKNINRYNELLPYLVTLNMVDNPIDKNNIEEELKEIQKKYPEEGLKCKFGANIPAPEKGSSDREIFNAMLKKNREWDDKNRNKGKNYIINKKEFEAGLDENKQCKIKKIIDEVNIRPLSDQQFRDEIDPINIAMKNTILKFRKNIHELRKIGTDIFDLNFYDDKSDANFKIKLKNFCRENIIMKIILTYILDIVHNIKRINTDEPKDLGSWNAETDMKFSFVQGGENIPIRDIEKKELIKEYIQYFIDLMKLSKPEANLDDESETKSDEVHEKACKSIDYDILNETNALFLKQIGLLYGMEITDKLTREKDQHLVLNYNTVKELRDKYGLELDKKNLEEQMNEYNSIEENKKRPQIKINDNRGITNILSIINKKKDNKFKPIIEQSFKGKNLNKFYEKLNEFQSKYTDFTQVLFSFKNSQYVERNDLTKKIGYFLERINCVSEQKYVLTKEEDQGAGPFVGGSSKKNNKKNKTQKIKFKKKKYRKSLKKRRRKRKH